ncbi:MAG TPA: gluconate 2-dehydrogenase subunit 3 family protein [Vicinamibacterales bacterium]
MLAILGATPAAALTWKQAEAEAAQAAAAKPAAKPAAVKGKTAGKAKFFTTAEYATVVMLSNIIIPKDERSGSASDAGVPEFIDFTMAETLKDQPERQTAIRGGLAWLGNESLKRFSGTFTKVTDAQRTQILDDIAYPKKAKPEMSHGVRFFNGFRDLVASGFFSSKMGMADLQYIGNQPSVWNGSPPEVMQKVGVSYDE